jgi:hypothetical protein
LAILITPSIVAEVFSVDIYREETERRWQIPRKRDKKLMNAREKEVISYKKKDETNL